MSTSCLLGSPHSDGRTATVVKVSAGFPPEQMLPLLRQVHSVAFDGETTRMAERLLTHGWLQLGIDLPTSPTAEARFAGVLTHTPLGLVYVDPPAPFQVRIGQPLQAGMAQWLYLLDERDDTVVVYEATVHGRWLRHSHHPLRLTRPEPLPATIAAAGDAATARHVHRWRPACVSLDGWSGAWDAQICTVEYDRGVIVARLDTDTLAGVIADTDAWLAERRPGSGLPDLHVDDGGRLTVTWFAGTGHRQQHTIDADPDGRFLLGPHVLPWILAGEPVPGSDPRHLRNGTPPIVEWATETALHACHPALGHYPLPVLAAALRALSGCLGGGIGVLAPTNGATGHHVWLLTDGHALLVTPTSHDPDAGTVTLPRPLAGSWSDDQPVPVFTASQLAAFCRPNPAP
ncbi:hypothetical protein [Virgisporangium aurantiacum]|uniref:Uncharacterized protein n=1 Tax=Virgisporangium aurantiacum TaxID=175570 RepID=A0A8J3ZKW7_9ACTN|nr:hypothetical protein [Virgisporangium aurantiacum]GIJ64837.1 hypothetical protein Vau01_123530 [Virgisporangium aurantiacum]